jgi:hypothetical protein
MKLKTISIIALLSAFYPLPHGVGAADVNVTIKYRQNYMNALSGHTGALRRLSVSS